MSARMSSLLPTLTLSVLSLLALPSTTVQLAIASPASYTLLGIDDKGWGFAPNAILSPGPNLTAVPGETVELSLAGADTFSGIFHNFGVDYNDNGFADSGEPVSDFFAGSPIQYSFIATNAEGKYRYYCYIHPTIMYGAFTVASVAVTGVTVSRPFAYAGVNSEPIQMSVTVTNQQAASRTFTLTTIANTTTLGTQTVTLPGGSSTVVPFSWDAHLMPMGRYVLSARLSNIQGQADLVENNLTYGIFTVRFKGDVNDDCTVNIIDLALVGAGFGSTGGPPASSNWNANADLNNDNTVNIIDLANVGAAFGQSCS